MATMSLATGLMAIEMRMKMRTKLCPVSITIISSGMYTEATERKRVMKMRRRRVSPLSTDTTLTSTKATGRKRRRMSQMSITIMSLATDIKAT